MAPALHALLLASYVAVAAAIAYALPILLPEVHGPTLAVAAFLACLVGHLFVLRSLDLEGLNGAIEEAAEAALAARREAEGVHARLADLRREVEARADQRSAELVAEIQVLQSLLMRLAAKPARAAAARPAPLAEHAPEPAPATPDAAARAPDPAPSVPPPSPVPPERGEETSDLEIFDIVRQALDENRIDLYAQPIVALPQRRTRYLETFSRIRDGDGAIVRPQRYLPVAERAGLLGALDNLLLFRCLQLVRELRRRANPPPVLVNVSSNTLRDADFLPHFVDFIEHNRELADGLVFEFGHGDLDELLGPLAGTLARLARFGFTFSLDHVPSLDLDVETLAERRFRFVKIEAETFLADPMAGRRLAARLERAGIALVVEKIEDERTVVRLLDHHEGLAQGYLFGQPRPARDFLA